MDKKLQQRLNLINEELMELERPQETEEAPEILDLPRRRGLSRAERSEREKLQELDPIEKRSVPVMKKRNPAGLLFALLILGILCAIGWWKL